ncbi:cmgc srpk protein kinase [Fusarium avenaceum]|nr:cmgc srpk protein kinase [Fusarium avenaceum]
MIRAWPLKSLYRRPWPISSVTAPLLDPLIPIEEERTPDYHADRFYPIKLGQVLNKRYQVATKLGHGANSTVWLARDLNRWRWTEEKYVAIKVNSIGRPSRFPPDNEIDILRHVSQVNPKHTGWHCIRKLSDSFSLDGSLGAHRCLVMEALREPLWLFCKRFKGGVIPPVILKIQIQMILEGLDYLHSECQVIHSDLKPDNIMVKAEDVSIFQRDAQDEFDDPLPQKPIDDKHTIYLCRNNYGRIVAGDGCIRIVDFDLSSRSKPGQIHTGAIQGEIFRAPEVILDAGYSYSADIWSLGVMVSEVDPRQFAVDANDRILHGLSEYDDESHLGQITALIGPRPQNILSNGRRDSMFYNSNGELRDPGRVPEGLTFDSTIKQISGEEKVQFIRFVKRMMKWNPEERDTARQLLSDPWLEEKSPQD